MINNFIIDDEIENALDKISFEFMECAINNDSDCFYSIDCAQNCGRGCEGSCDAGDCGGNCKMICEGNESSNFII